MGDSAARWDGDTLVVDVTGFNDKTWLSGNGKFSTARALHVVERFQIDSDDTITYTATVTEFESAYQALDTGLAAALDTRVEEYECIENDRTPMQVKK